jgi:hypothetical protein
MTEHITTQITTATPPAATGTWIRSSRCTPQNNCVELRSGPGSVDVRDSKNAGGTTLAFGHAEWTTFLGKLAPVK